MVSYGSDKKVWWKCEECGYEWKGAVKDYARSNGCKECTNKKLGKQVRCVETGIVYYSVRNAGKETGITVNNI